MKKTPNPSSEPLVDFGYQSVPLSQKAEKVADVFRSVADKYDVMNDLMSLGVHRLWKKYALSLAQVRPGQQVLDLAGGTGDLSLGLSKEVGETGLVVLADINEKMLKRGRERLIDQGCVQAIRYAQADAENLPFPDHTFDLAMIGFGLRNVTRKEKALESLYRVLTPGGKLLILEFSKPVSPVLSGVYDAYSFNVLPWLGKLVVGDSESYRYLAESIRQHPDQETLKKMMETAGFENCDYHNLTGGIVAVHRGYKW